MFKFLLIGFNLISHSIDRLGIQFLVENIFSQNFEGTATLWSSILLLLNIFFILVFWNFTLMNPGECFFIYHVGFFSLEIYALQFWKRFLYYIFENFLPFSKILYWNMFKKLYKESLLNSSDYAFYFFMFYNTFL